VLSPVIEQQIQTIQLLQKQEEYKQAAQVLKEIAASIGVDDINYVQYLILQSLNCEGLGLPAEQEYYAIQALDLIKEPGKQKAQALMLLAAAKRDQSEYKQAIVYLEQVLELCHLPGLDSLKARCMGTMGTIYEHLSEYDLSLEYLEKAIHLHKSAGYKKGEAVYLCNIGNIHLVRGNYNQALYYYESAMEIDTQIDNKKGMANNAGNIGLIYWNLSDFHKAVEYYRIAIDLDEQINHPHGVARWIGNLGSVYAHMGDFHKALEYFNRALQLEEQLQNRPGMANAIGNIGNVYTVFGEFDKALEFYSRALDLYTILGNKTRIASWLGNIGALYAKMKEYDKALEYMKKALEITQEMGNKPGTAGHLANIGGVYANQDFAGYDSNTAQEYFQKAIAINKDLGRKKLLYENYKSMSDLHRQIPDWQGALEYYELYHELQKEVHTEEAERAAARIDAERREAEREKQIIAEKAAAQARIEEQQRLIHNILPPQIAERLLAGETFIADHFESVSILFLDIVHFTPLASRIPPRSLVYLLDTLFSTTDTIIRKHGLEKIKTIGDSYMAVCGAPLRREDHAVRTAAAALELLECMKNLMVEIPAELMENNVFTFADKELQIRIGLHCGEAVGGILGKDRYVYDFWGDAVNMASRMESHGLPAHIHCSTEFKNAVIENINCGNIHGFSAETMPVFIERGIVEIKGKGIMNTYFLKIQNEGNV
jgi:class 3 adenylate cyclase